jgi:DNA-binding transcriptional LysR family regulator
VQRFRAARPDVLVRLHAMSALDVVNQVADHRADLGVILGGSGDARVEAHLLCTSGIGCALPRHHALAARRSLSLAELAAVPLISLGPQQPVGLLVQAAQAGEAPAARLAIEVSQSSIACALVRAGAGVAILDGFGLAEAAAQGLVVRPLTPRIPLDVTLIVCRGRVPSRLALGLRAGIEQTASAAAGWPPARRRSDPA